MPVTIIDTLKPKNGGSFPIVEAIDVFVEGFDNLADAVSHFATDVMIEAINTVLSDKANTSDVNTAVANLQAQINELITPVTQDAEVQNARVSISGSTYTTLKERLDTEYTRITNVTNEIQLSDIVLERGDVSSSDGSMVDSTSRLRTQNYIHGSFNLKVNREHWVIRKVVYYNENDLSFDSGESINTGSAAIGKTGCVAKISFGKTDSSTVKVTDFKRSTALEDLSSGLTQAETQIERDKNSVTEIQFSDIILEQGGIDSSDGSTTDSTTRLRTQNYIYGTFDLRVNREHWVIRQVAYYNVSDLSFNSGESINSGSAVIGKTDCIAKISFSKTDNSNVTVSDLKRSTDFETLSSIVKYGESISANTDINNITKIGIYRYSDSTSNVSNLPVARSGKLIVSAGTSASNSRAIQTFYPYWSTIKGDYYIRSLVSTGWTEWYKYEGKPISQGDIDITKYQKWHLFQTKTIVAPSSITIINNKLYVFCYTQLNEATSNNTIYLINEDGTIGAAERHFNSTIGHQNTVDYNEENDCLIASRYDEASELDGIFSMYIFKNASALRHFYVEDCMEIPLNDLLPGNTSLNCVWGDNNAGKNDIVYATSRDRELQKRYITRIQLGKGSNNLGSGTIIPDCPDDEFNGTFKIQKSFEIPWGGESGVTEGTNDMCFYNGKIYRGMNGHNSFSEHEIVDFDTTFSTKKIKIPMYNDEGTEIDVEPEGITIYNHILYFATGDKRVHVIKWD